MAAVGPTCWRLRLAWRAEPSFSSCFALIFTISCRNFSLASLESSPLSRACFRLSSSTSRPASGGTLWPGKGGAAGTLSADGTLQLAPRCSPGELRSLAELLEEVNDGDDKEDREEATVRRTETRKG